jgi:trehalose 6-phosphate phosphatase
MSVHRPARASDVPEHPGNSGATLPQFADDWALFLDVDGTVLDLAEHPKTVRVESALAEVLGRLQTLTGGAVALVSGRSVSELDDLFRPLHLSIAGQHGAECRHATGEMDVDRAGIETEFARSALAAFARRDPGLYFEDKGVTLAMHYRHAPHLEALVERTLADLARRSGGELTLQTGKMVRELVPHGKNKGGAIAQFMTEPPFADRLPVFIGDDDTDEHGFALVNRMRGHTIKVGPGASVALYRLPGARRVRDWLRAYASWLERRELKR